MATPPLATYDLHLHTYWSYDATAHVESYFRRAEALGLRCIAITEHHNLDSLADTGKAARRYPTVRWLRAAELTVTTSLGSVDLVCFGFPPELTAPLRELLHDYHEWQRACGAAISAGMVALGLDYSDRRRAALLESYRPLRTLRVQGMTHVRNGTQRAHFVRRRFIANPDEYPDVLSRAGRHVPRPAYPAADRVVPVLHDHGVLVAVAHPHGPCRGADLSRLDTLRAECELDGFECAHSSMPPELTPVFRDYCVRHGMFSTAGSDCHLDHEAESVFARHYGGDRWLDEVLDRLA